MFLGNLIGGQSGLQFSFVLALIMNGTAYFFSDTIVLRLYNAQPLDCYTYADICAMVEELAKEMRIPTPKLWLVKTPMANAFATGRSPKKGSIAFTTGILSLLDKRELRGVIAHELSHIKNRDTLITTIAATLATAIGYLANMLYYAQIFRSSGSQRRDGANPMIAFIVALIMPIAATLIQLALSRSREYQADYTGACSSHDPIALARALEKLHNHIPQAHMDPNDTTRASTASLFIVNPFSQKKWLTTLFSTHPPVTERIARLQKLHEEKIK